MRQSLFWALLLLCSGSFAGTEKPNLVLIFTDDHGWPDLGSAGVYDDLKTPHLDQMAIDGVRCTNGYVTAPQCVPSRGGLLAGRDQSRFGLETNGSSLEGFNAEITIGERLQKQGYKTGQIGKWHLGPSPEIGTHGFDEVYQKNSARPAFATYQLDGSDREPGPDDSKLYHLDACTEAALAFLDRHGEGPFFLYLAYRAPHVPLDAPDKYLSRFPGEMPERRRQALAMISAMDDGVGRIREKLEEKGLTRETLLFFIGDNGAPLKIHKVDAPGGGPGWDGSLNEPMNGEKGMLSEGGIRVPFLVAWPGTIPGGQVYDHPVISLDVAATAVALSGMPEDPRLDGVNLIPFFNGELSHPPHEALFWRWSSQAAVRIGDWKYLRGGSREYLYDLVEDPGESKNRFKERPEKAEELRARLKAWTEELDPPGFVGTAMPQTWERYFDHYLEGQEMAKENIAEENDSQNVGGWIARNSKIKAEGGVLRLLDPDGKQRLRPFLANSKLSLKGPLHISVELGGGLTGKLFTSWRMEGQDDFGDEKLLLQVEGENPHKLSGVIPVSNRIIHLRLLFPNGNASIKEIRISDPQGKTIEEWNFE